MYTLSYAKENLPWASNTHYILGLFLFLYHGSLPSPLISLLFHEAGSHIQDWPQIYYDFELLIFKKIIL